MNLLEVQELSVSYGPIRALQGVSISVDEGEIVCIIGPNGAGKSSLLRSLSGQVPMCGGKVIFEGNETRMSVVEAVRAGIIQCPEGRDLFETLTVEENLKLGAARRSQPFRDLVAEIDHLTELFPILRERWQQRAGTLSGGEQQMLAIGRAVIARPRLMLLDEPALGLAPKLVHQLFEVLPSLVQSRTSILLVEQNVRAALSVAERGYLLRSGQIELVGSCQELQQELLSSEAFLG